MKLFGLYLLLSLLVVVVVVVEAALMKLSLIKNLCSDLATNTDTKFYVLKMFALCSYDKKFNLFFYNQLHPFSTSSTE